jgi:Rod binding domain-containing protein
MRDAAGNTPFWDSSSLSKLKLLSQNDSPETRTQAAREAAQYFEGMFFQMMMKSAKPIDGQREGLFSSTAMNSFQDMFESQVSLNAGRRGTGLAKVIEQQLLGKTATTERKS